VILFLTRTAFILSFCYVESGMPTYDERSDRTGLARIYSGVIRLYIGFHEMDVRVSGEDMSKGSCKWFG
jgi:hypothetical protein